MASKTLQKYGYNDDRFEVAISEGFHCPICLNVLKEPKICKNNDHLFCEACITEHLHNSSTCPECMDELTPETLLRPSRSFMKCHSELKIKCDYADRGCREYVELGNFKIHNKSCSFAPTNCSNKGCGMLVNKRDKLYHEGELCKYRRRKDCCNCAKMESKVDDLTNKLEEMMKSEMEKSKSKPIKNNVKVYKKQENTGPRWKVQEQEGKSECAVLDHADPNDDPFVDFKQDFGDLQDPYDPLDDFKQDFGDLQDPYDPTDDFMPDFGDLQDPYDPRDDFKQDFGDLQDPYDPRDDFKQDFGDLQDPYDPFDFFY